jgi:prepilin-type N-terminal cleavage/methylation domain-containing protein/prepilin-type processing-associated H-X9-DG protein
MPGKKGFTLIELLVVIAIIALLMSILMPALSKAKEQARAVVCMSNMHQWAIVWKLYTDENQGRFPDDNEDWLHDVVVFGTGAPAGPPGGAAVAAPGTAAVLGQAVQGRYEKLLLCPSASKPAVPAGNDDVLGGKRNAWIFTPDDDDAGERTFVGSYGINYHITHDIGPGRTKETMWKSVSIKGAAYVPIMLDCARWGGTPLPLDQPPEWDGQIYYSNPKNIDEIRGFCINRHSGYVDCLFVDFHVEKVSLKRLWILQWHRGWPIPASHPLPEWPTWMRPLPDPF